MYSMKMAEDNFGNAVRLCPLVQCRLVKEFLTQNGSHVYSKIVFEIVRLHRSRMFGVSAFAISM